MKKVYLDQMGRKVELMTPPKRIISLVPSQTELLFDLGLDEEVVGITRFCIHPQDKVKQRKKVGGPKNFDFDAIHDLQPDLIIGNKEENYQEGIEKLSESYPLWMSDIHTLADSLQMIRELGTVLGKKLKGEALAGKIESAFQKFHPLANTPSVAYLIWRKPFMLAGSNTFIHEMLRACGLNNVACQLNQDRYPEVSAEQLQQLNPDYIFLSSEPYPFKQKHLPELQQLCPQAKIILVDGEMFSWYGSRLLQSTAYFQQDLFPQLPI